MEKSWHGILNVGIIHFMAYPQVMKGEGPIIETLTEIVRDDFFTAVEFRRTLDEKVREQVKSVIQQSGITPLIAGQPPLLVGKLNLNALDETERQKAIDEVKKSVDEAYYMDAKAMAILSGVDPGENDRDKAKSLLIDSLVQICKYAQSKATDYTLLICLETFDRDIDKKCLIGPTKEAVVLAREVKQKVDNFGLTIDLSHLPLLNETPEESLTLAKDYLVHTHIGNCIMKDKNQPGYGDQHPRFGVHGGENDVNEIVRFLKTLKQIGYFEKRPNGLLPVLSFEVKPLPGESSELVIANTKRAFWQAWNQL